MTPEEITRKHKLVTQDSVEEFAQYLDHWMCKNGQPEKDIISFVKDMKKDGCSPSQQARSAATTIVDWFAYGN